MGREDNEKDEGGPRSSEWMQASGIILSISNSQTVPRDWAVRFEFVLDQLFSRGVLEWAR